MKMSSKRAKEFRRKSLKTIRSREWRRRDNDLRTLIGDFVAAVPEIEVTESGAVISSKGLFSVAARLSPSASELL